MGNLKLITLGSEKDKTKQKNSLLDSLLDRDRAGGICADIVISKSIRFASERETISAD